MIYRKMFRTVKLIDLQEIKKYDIVACTVSKNDGFYYMYIETDGKENDIYKLFEEDEHMLEIFHYCPITDRDEWVKQRINPKGAIRFNKVLPEKFASYIFHHFRLQEEYRGERTKYSSIFVYGTQLAMYEERPIVKFDPKVEGILKTNDTDFENWQEDMKKHFVPSENPWGDGEYIYSYYPILGK